MFQFNPTLETTFEDIKSEDCEVFSDVYISETLENIKESKTLLGVTQAGIILKFKKVNAKIQPSSFMNAVYSYMNFKVYHDQELDKDFRIITLSKGKITYFIMIAGDLSLEKLWKQVLNKITIRLD